MFAELGEQLSVWAIPVLLCLIPLYGFIKGISVYEVFVKGAEEGFYTAIRIMPFLVAMMVAINVFRTSGALQLIVNLIDPIMNKLFLPSELLPLAIMRSLSGSGSLGMTTEILNHYGPDSILGITASTILGSTDTTFYVLTVYFASIGIRNPRYSVYVGLLGDIVGFICSVYICNLFFV